MEYAYYAKLIKDGFHTQCTLDLESGAVKIQDVPFEFRNTEAYEAAHLYARTIKDEKERHALIAEDMIKPPDIVIHMNTYARNADM